MDRPVLTPEEAQLSYAKYFNQPLAAIPQEKLDVWQGPMADPSTALAFEDRAKFQRADVPGLQDGFTVAPNGTGFVANTTFMPGVTAEMIDWWFGWHSVTSDLRYKMWDKEDHWYARADKPEYVKDPNVPLNQKTWGVNHSIKEDIGLGADDLLLCFRRPSELGYDESLIGTDDCLAMVCAYGLGSAPALMTHIARKAEGGILFCSRFWMGYGPNQEGQLVKLVPDGVSIPEIVPRALYGHNIKEYSNLAAILPSVYAEEKDKPW
ncbi:MAG TPA: phloretin hydrolase [Clostridiales bacterium]|nr:phloretin hydrolase [Clostridiales bacterium]